MTEIFTNATDWKKEYKSLKQKINNMDKEAFKVFYFTKTTTMKNDILGLTEMEDKFNFERQVERDELNNFIAILKKELKNLKEALKIYNKTPEYLNKIQKMTENIENKISSFKEKQLQKFNNLIEEETQLYHEIMLINDRMEAYEAPPEIEEPRKASSASARASSSRPFRTTNKLAQSEPVIEDEDDVEEAEKPVSKAEQGLERKMKKLKNEIEVIDAQIVELGGKNQGWDNEDHQTFLKVKTKFKNQIDKIAFMNDCITCLPFLGEDKIKEHIEKHKKYTALEDKKKELLNEYKDCKDNQKQLLIDAIRKEDEEKKQKEQKKKALVTKTKEELEKQKEDIKNWKIQKMAQEIVNKENKQIQAIEKKKEEDAVKRAQKVEVQQKLEEFKVQKEYERLRKKEKEEYEKSLNSRPLTREDIARLREKEEEILKKKKEMLETAKQKQLDKATRTQKLIESKGDAYVWVEPRLNEQTKAAEDKKRAKYDPVVDGKKNASTFGGQVARFSGKAIPSWRQGL